MADQRRNIFSEKTLIPVGLALGFGTLLFMAGVKTGQLDDLTRLEIPKNLLIINSRLATIENALGIPANRHHVGSGQTYEELAAIALRPSVPLPRPRPEVAIPE